MNNVKTGIRTKIGLFLASIAPGIFLIGYNIGTGSVTTVASTGAAYGMTLIWPLALSCIFTYVLIVAFGRYTAITGDTALFREMVYPWWFRPRCLSPCYTGSFGMAVTSFLKRYS
ncbi:MAG: hypothetical protein P8184_03555 [Calditrichia bacterium]